MGYHDGGDIPNYWAYARAFVLQDHMLEPNASWSLPENCSRSPSGQRTAPHTTNRGG
jgi:phospholipase C